MKIVFLDAKSIGEDIDLSAYDALGEVIKYDFSTPEEAAVRSVDADVLVLNKVEVNEKTIGNASHLKLVCVTATGTNNLDKAYLEKRGIAWRNVAGYSTESVAQHTFAMLFYLLEKLPYYDRYVKLDDENPTIGILLCKEKNDAAVELTLPESEKDQIFASKYETVLPSKEELKRLLEEY